MRSIIAMVAILLTIWIEWHPASAESIFANEWLRDNFVRMHAGTAPESRILVVDIDEASLAAIGPWPWPRQRIADLLENLLGAYGARGVALDLVLPEAADREGDTRLAMLAQHGPVVLAQAFDYVSRPLPLRIGQITGGTPGALLPAMPSASGFIANHAGLVQARHIGNIGFVPDADGTIRRLPMLTQIEGRRYPTLPLALLDCCAANPQVLSPAPGFRRIAFHRDWSAYSVVSASDILNLAIPPETMSGRLMLVGSSSLGLADRVATPLAPSTSGLLIHAAALSSLLDAQAGHAPAPYR